MKLYTIRDATLGKFFTKLFMLHNDAQAKRVFQAAIIGGDETMAANPDDYTLYRVGAYDDTTGIPIGHDPERVQTGLEALTSAMQDRERLEALHAEIAALSAIPEDE